MSDWQIDQELVERLRAIQAGRATNPYGRRAKFQVAVVTPDVEAIARRYYWYVVVLEGNPDA